LDPESAKHAGQHSLGVGASLFPELRGLRGGGHLGFGEFEELRLLGHFKRVGNLVEHTPILAENIGPVVVEVGLVELRLGQPYRNRFAVWGERQILVGDP
jgi:hypothetical protein